MPSKPKSFRHEYLSETILAILELKMAGQSDNKITYHLKIPKSSMTTIIYHKARQLEYFCQLNKQSGCPPKLDG